MNELGMNEEWTKAKMREGYLREKCAEEVEEYMHLTTCVGPNLKTQYMLCIGQLEYRVFQLKTDVARWQRRFTLRQQALNRGETPNLVQIEAQLDEEFQDYLRQVKEHLVAIKAAAQHASMARLSDEETSAIRVNYLKAVKRLHPDINAKTSENEILMDLWDRVMRAYRAFDVEKLEELEVTLNYVMTELGEEGFAPNIDNIDEKIKKLEKAIEQIITTVPYTYGELLKDPGAVEAKKQELKNELEEYRTYRKNLEETLEKLTGEGGGRFTWQIIL